MPKKVQLKTSKNNKSVADYIKTLPKEQQKDAKVLLKVFKEATKAKPKMWGFSIIGFGEYRYERKCGDYTDFLATGFSMRKSGPTLYIMPGYSDYSDLLAKLGPHKLGKACLYLKTLSDVHQPTLKKLIRAGLKDLRKTYLVQL